MDRNNGQRSKRMRTFIAYLVLCVSVIGIVVILDLFHAFDIAEQALYDLRFRIRGVADRSEQVVIVAIDSQTLEALGLTGMPPRDWHVPVIENLYRAGAKAVLFDVEFFGYRGGIPPGGLAPAPAPTDSLFADALGRYPDTVIARKLAKPVEEATGQSAGESPLPPLLFQAPGRLAFVDMIQDGDSVVRRARLISEDMDTEAGWQYSFALRAAMFALDADTAWVDSDRHRLIVGDREVPLDDSHPPGMLINYAADELSFARGGGYISYEQVMDPGEFGIQLLMGAERFTDKVVLIGATFPESHDTKETPFFLGTELFNPSEYPMYGVHVHKNIAETIIDGRFITPVRWWGRIVIIVLMGVLATLVNGRFRGWGGLALSVLLMAAYSGCALWLFLGQRVMAPMVAPSFGLVTLNYIAIVTFHFMTERKQKALIRGAFSQYVPSTVVNELLRDPEKLTLGGEERDMTVMFCDVAGFTAISENLTPTALVELLNEYLTAMTEVVFRYNGIIDKYEGDAIMAEFGAPLPDAAHAVNGCLAALDMQAELARLREEFIRDGRPVLTSRIGINSGDMVIGNMGSSKIFDYTVMGDNVNLSSRLEGANKTYGTAIICSEATRLLAADHIVSRELDLLRVKGRTAGVLVHEVLAKAPDGLDPGREQVIEAYLAGLEAYKNRAWADGVKLFEIAVELDSADTPSQVYRDRCREFILNPPADDWDGIFTMRTK